MKTITMDFDTYIKEQEKIKEKAFEAGLEVGGESERDFISELLNNPATYYGENWIREMAGKHTPEIEVALIRLHSKKSNTVADAKGSNK